MSTIITPETLTFVLLIVLYLVNRFNFSIRFKFFIVFIIFAESFSQLMFFYGKFNPLLSLIVLSTSFYIFVANYKDFQDMRETTNIKSSDESYHIPFRNYFVHIGIILFALVVILEFHLFDGNLSTSSILIIIQSILFYFFEKIPGKYSFERDFTFLFINSVVIFLIFPEVFFKIITNTAGKESPRVIDTDKFVEYALAIPLVKVLTLLNFTVFNNGQIIYYQDLVSHQTEAVVISQSCTGIYSVFIFLLASQSYLLAHFGKIDSSFFGLSIIIIIVSYISNIFRMTSIIIIGHYYGMDSLLYAHANIGWILFSFWVFVLFIGLEKFYVSSFKHKL